MRRFSIHARLVALAVGVLSLGASMSMLPAAATDTTTTNYYYPAILKADLDPLNNSGAHGHAHARIAHGKIKVTYRAHDLLAGVPHAAHIHFGAQARHECPSTMDDANRDFRINTAEGIPAYGPINVSLTTRGDFSPESALALARFPVADAEGTIIYERRRLEATTRKALRAIRHSKGVLVVHGVDYNNNGMYDMAGAGESELAEGVPAEATDPALCGKLRRIRK